MTHNFDSHHSAEIATLAKPGGQVDGCVVQAPLSFPAQGPAKGRKRVAHHFDQAVGPAAPEHAQSTTPDPNHRMVTYGNACAFTIEVGESAEDTPVICVEVASMRPEDSALGRNNKITVMLTSAEQLHVGAALKRHPHRRPE